METTRNSRLDEYLDEITEPYTIGSLTFSASDVLFNLDPTAYRCSASDMVFDEEEEEEDEE